MGEPVYQYLFGDDFEDNFNQLESAPEELWKCGIAFLADDEKLGGTLSTRPRHCSVRLRVSSGLRATPKQQHHPTASEALNDFFREDVDRVVDAILEKDTRPSARSGI